MGEKPEPEIGRHVLSPEQRDAYVKHLHKTVADVSCQWCGKNKWIPSDHYVVPLILTPQGEATLNNVPLIPLMLNTCGNCGNTLFFNAVIAGVFGEEGAANASKA